jgi:sugar phosphate isomerase/epimerase
LPCAELDKLRVFTGWRGTDPAAVLPRVAAIINEMAQTAAKAKIHLLVENEGACNVATCAELAALMKLFRPNGSGSTGTLAGSGGKHSPARTGCRLPAIQ